jgi:hypothetical protein
MTHEPQSNAAFILCRLALFPKVQSHQEQYRRSHDDDERHPTKRLGYLYHGASPSRLILDGPWRRETAATLGGGKPSSSMRALIRPQHHFTLSIPKLYSFPLTLRVAESSRGRAHHCLAQPMPTTCQRLGEPQSQGAHIPAPRIHPSHAPKTL